MFWDKNRNKKKNQLSPWRKSRENCRNPRSVNVMDGWMNLNTCVRPFAPFYEFCNEHNRPSTPNDSAVLK